MKLKFMFAAGTLGVVSLMAGRADATLMTLASYVGTDSLSTGGCGTTATSCSFTSIVPTGSTVLAAYLYTSLIQNAGIIPTGTLTGAPFLTPQPSAPIRLGCKPTAPM